MQRIHTYLAFHTKGKEQQLLLPQTVARKERERKKKATYP